MPSFGIMTALMQVDYHDILRVWQEADAIASATSSAVNASVYPRHM